MHGRWAIPAVLVLVAAAAVASRLPDLAQRPMHGDEAVQCDIFRRLWETGEYRYDLDEYHGPTLPYVTWPVMWLAGARTFENSTEHIYRAVPLVFGLLLILLLPLTANALGTAGTLIAALLIAFSPAMVFFSRYYIHEMLLVAFTFGAIGCGWRFVRTGRMSWAALTGACIGLMHATKETWVLAAGAAAVAIALTYLWGRIVDRPDPAPEKPGNITPRRLAAACAVALAAAAAVAVVLFSSFFTHARGPLDSILTYKVYLHRGTAEGVHNHPWYTYLKWFFWHRYGRAPVHGEWLIAAAAIVGLICALLPRRRHAAVVSSPDGADVAKRQITAFRRFMAFYALALTAAYSAVSYKTPWCALSFLHAMILLGAAGIDTLWAAMRRTWPRLMLAAAVVAGLAHLAHLAYRLNYVHYADYRLNPMVYGHPTVKVYELVNRVDEILRISPAGADTFVSVITKDCWPLPWYFRRYHRVGWWQEVSPANTAAPLIITMYDKFNEVNDMLGDRYVFEYRGLRPGVPLVLFVRKDLWEMYLRSRGLK